jgi:hypothetical protein
MTALTGFDLRTQINSVAVADLFRPTHRSAAVNGFAPELAT